MKLNNLTSVAIFCGASKGNDPGFTLLATKVGVTLARHGLTVVYGGSNDGLMGIMADAALAEGGNIIGVMPEDRNWGERIHPRVKLIMVPNMSERKKKMSELSDAAIALPGAFGTLDEITEFITWTELGIHNKPCGLLNTRGYYDKFIEFLNESVFGYEFATQQTRNILQDSSDLDNLLLMLDQRCCSEKSNLAQA